ncbi:MAG: TRAP transporter small permease [Alphaproteobacteria bacterium]|nr:TRAP transporter small permease [Alphaproteobacteria bacterium]
MIRIIDRLSGTCGYIAAWVFVAIGAILAFEVAMRYLFNAPTIWVGEIARLAQLWATYFAAAFLLRDRGLIRITALTERLGARGQRRLEVLALAWIGAFSAAAIWYGIAIAAESIRVGRAESTMLALPQWAGEIAIPVGFALLLLQVIAELLRLRHSAKSGNADATGG